MPALFCQQGHYRVETFFFALVPGYDGAQVFGGGHIIPRFLFGDDFYLFGFLPAEGDLVSEYFVLDGVL